MNENLISKLRNDIRCALLLPPLPEYIVDLIHKNDLIKSLISDIEKELGKEKAQELVTQIKNEAYAQTGSNFTYIIDKLYSVKRGLKNNLNTPNV